MARMMVGKIRFADGWIGSNLGVVRCTTGFKACRNSADPSCDRSELNAALIRLGLRFTFTGNAVY
jgi:hypothetical protein